MTDAWAFIREPRAPFGNQGAQIGLAILMSRRGDDLVYDHSGGTGGFRTTLELVPAQRRATVLLLNNDTIEPAAVLASARSIVTVEEIVDALDPRVTVTLPSWVVSTG